MSQQDTASSHPAAFRRLWTAYAVSVFGDQVTLLAIPLAAALTLHASAFQMGLLAAAGTLPHLLVSLPAGVWIDRRRKRPVMVAADLLRLFVLLIVPALAAIHLLGMAALYAVQFVAGCSAVVGVIAASSFLPAVVGRERLVEANSRLRGSDAVSQVAGPGLAGVLVQVAGAPYAILADAVSFLFSALVIGRFVRVSEPRTAPAASASMRAELREGLAFTLGKSAGIVGLVFGAGSVGAVLGAACAAPLSRRFGLGRVTIAGELLVTAGTLLLPLAGGPTWVAALLLVAAEFVAGFGVLLFDVNVSSLRQAITPDELLARTSSVGRFVTQGTRPLGALIGGVLGVALGLRGAMLIAGVCGFMPLLWLVRSPLAAMRTLPPMIGSPSAPRAEVVEKV